MTQLTHLVGKRIRDMRTQKNISQEELALLADISRAHIGRIERGAKSPTVDTVERIAKALDCHPSVFFAVKRD